jgi:hypothetical protein
MGRILGGMTYMSLRQPTVNASTIDRRPRQHRSGVLSLLEQRALLTQEMQGLRLFPGSHTCSAETLIARLGGFG